MSDIQEKKNERRFWADYLAQELVETDKRKHIVATGITPSGPIHLGNLREVLTGDAVYRALDKAGAQAQYIYIADTFDPLRKVYPFLPEEYREHIGKPLYLIPDPYGCCPNYAEHFLQPFLSACNELNIKPKVYRSHEIYSEGLLDEAKIETVRRREEVRNILQNISGRELAADWFPLNILCPQCQKLSSAKVTGVNLDQRKLEYQCDCGSSGEIDFTKGAAKLPWRIEWPARWRALNVTVEPFGKDHAAAGGSYDTGKALARDIFDYTAPHPVLYEWIYLKGLGPMSSSTGVGISAEDLLKFMPSALIRYLVLRVRPEKHLDFDAAQMPPFLKDDFLQLGHRVEEGTAESWEKEVYEFSLVGGPIAPVPLVHLSILLQTTFGDIAKTRAMLEHSGYNLQGVSDELLSKELELAGEWLKNYAPEALKFKVAENLPEEANTLSAEQKEYLSLLAGKLAGVSWNAQDIHDNVYNISQEKGLKPKQAFAAVYTVILGKGSGPRAGWFLSSLEKDWVLGRFREAFSTLGEGL